MAIVSTARKISLEELQPALDFIEKWGLQIILGQTIGAEECQFAGDDAFRTRDFQQMLDNPEIKAIWCAKGGYGTVRLIDRLDFSSFVKNPKWIIGYSDVTVLHSHIHNLGIQTLHAQTLLGLENKSAETSESIRAILFGKQYTIRVKTANALNISGRGEGQLIGGNLSILYSLCGSASSINTDGKILFLEDLDEYLYHVDRMMMNLKRNGFFKNLSGLIVGGMTGMHDNTIPFGKTAEEIILGYAEGGSFPVCFQFPSGHIMDNRALVLGKVAVLEVDKEQAELRYQ